jgi:hypothetical protein
MMVCAVAQSGLVVICELQTGNIVAAIQLPGQVKIQLPPTTFTP